MKWLNRRYRRYRGGYVRLVPGLYGGQHPPLHRPVQRSWWRRWFPVLTGLLLLVLAPIIAYAQGADTVVVSWTAPGDDGRIGTATAYDLRWSLQPITESNFSSANVVTGVPVPTPSGSRQQATVHGLTRGTTYYFALRTRDDGDLVPNRTANWSRISNVLRWDWNLDATAPAAPQGLSVERQGTNVRLRWTANTEPDLRGYNVYRASSSSGPYTKLNDSPMTGSEYTDDSVPEGEQVLWYQLSAIDVNGNESPRGAATSVRLTIDQVAWAMQESYPNPSRAADPVHIPVVNSTASAGPVVIDILDSGGRIVRRIERILGPGSQNVDWDGKNDGGRECAPGAYRAVLNVDGKRTSIRLLRVP